MLEDDAVRETEPVTVTVDDADLLISRVIVSDCDSLWVSERATVTVSDDDAEEEKERVTSDVLESDGEIDPLNETVGVPFVAVDEISGVREILIDKVVVGGRDSVSVPVLEAEIE